MFTIVHYRRSLQILFAIFLCTFLFITCIDRESKKVNSVIKYEQYAGSSTCINCHKDIYNSHIQTAHYLTSQKANEKNIKGSFKDGENRFYFNAATFVAEEKRGDQLFQVEYVNGEEKKFEPFDITVGSGKRGQTYLYWDQNKLFQLPISYFTSVNQWSNSPGFSNRIVFKRPITSRCLECHSTYFEKTSKEGIEPEDFSKKNIVYGVDCERCHGPAAQHVDFHQKNPNEKKGQFIINLNSFTRKQKLESCRVCHGGKIPKTKPSFSFQAGDNLSDYFAIDTIAKDVADIDVHGNQYGMMIASKCFKMSEMTCGTCHSPHENETGKVTTFSQRCMNCHNEEHNNFCKAKDKVGKNIVKNCIDCHMPELPSKSVMVLLQGESTPTFASMRAHFISVYPDETKKFLAANKK